MRSFFCHLYHRPAFVVIVTSFFLTFMPFVQNSRAKTLFPNPSVITANVDFWEKIYTTYSTHSAVIHDEKDLSRIYGVVSLIAPTLPNASRLNRALMRLGEKRYRTILHNLAAGKKPTNALEKKIAAMFRGPQRIAKMKEATTNVRSQRGLKEKFIEGVVRSGASLERLKKIFTSQGLPAELAYLPHVESSFLNTARSRSQAAGIWQFTRATGSRYLRISTAIDERLDPFISGMAAAQYLKNSYQKLGNWPMAITAYNYGTAGMLRAQKALGSYEQIFLHYDQGYFGFASRNFYAEFLAALRVAKRLEKSSLVREKPLVFSSVVLPGYVSLASLRRHFKVTDEKLRNLNPALKRLVFEGKKLVPKGYPLRLPKDNAFIAQPLPQWDLHTAQKPDTSYRVRPGDTASEIAAKYHISLSQLRNANGLDKTAKIYSGQRLHIPDKTTATKKPPRLKQQRKKHRHGEQQIPVLSDTKKKTPRMTLTSSLKKKLPIKRATP